MEGKKVYGGFSGVTFSAYSDYITSTFVSASTLSGQINAIYIGTGLTTPNNVTNTEISYLNGLNSNVQLQITGKGQKNQNYLTYNTASTLTNYRKLTNGINITSTTQGNYISFSYLPNIQEYNVNIIDDSPIGVNNIVNNYNPTGWDGTLPNKSTEIRMNPTNLILITNLLGNVNGRICRLRNISRYPIILQYNNSGTGRFIFRGLTDYVLRPNKTMMFTCINDEWVEFGDIKYYGFDYIDTFKITVSDQTTTTSNASINTILPKKSSNFVFSANTTQLSNYIFYWDVSFKLYTKNFHAPSTGTNLKFYTVGQFNKKTILNNSGSTILMESRLGQPSQGSAVNSNLNMPVVVNGFTNFDLSYGYQSATSNYTSHPNFNGGLFFVGVFGNNYSAITQYNNGTSNIIDTGINYLNPLSLGVCVLTKSNVNNGEVIYYIKNNATNDYTIFNKIILDSEILNSFPNLSIFSNNINTIPYTCTLGNGSYIALRFVKMSKD